MTQRLRLFALLGLAVLALVVTAFWVTLWPWFAPPPASSEVIAAHWAQVETLAARSRYPEAPIGALKQGLEHVKRYEETTGTHGNFQDFNAAQPPQPVTDSDGQQAIAALVEWAAQGGGLGHDICEGALPVVEFFPLARLALSQAADDRDPAFTAVLRLGAYLRARGGLLSTAVGFGIADQARSVMEARGGRAGQAPVSFAPRREEVVPALAREAVCSMRLAERGLAQLDEAPKAGWVERWMSTRMGLARELAMVRWYFGERIAAAAAAGDDLTAVAATQVLPSEGSLPRSFLVRILVTRTDDRVREWDAIITRYAAYASSAH